MAGQRSSAPRWDRDPLAGAAPAARSQLLAPSRLSMRSICPDGEASTRIGAVRGHVVHKGKREKLVKYSQNNLNECKAKVLLSQQRA